VLLTVNLTLPVGGSRIFGRGVQVQADYCNIACVVNVNLAT